MEENESKEGRESGEGFDTAQLERIMSVVRLVKGLSEAEADAHTSNAQLQPAVSPSDEIQAINAINAAIPYLDYNYRKPIGILVKMIEMNRIINSYETMTLSNDGGSSNDRKKRMLMAIRPELDTKKQRMLDIFIRVMEIKDIMEVMGVAEN